MYPGLCCVLSKGGDDIYKAVRAECLAAGEWYYGPVSLEDVVGLLDAAVEAGVLELK